MGIFSYQGCEVIVSYVSGIGKAEPAGRWHFQTRIHVVCRVENIPSGRLARRGTIRQGPYLCPF